MRTLGELETRIMRVLWRARGPVTVRQVHTRLGRDRTFAYTTVMTVMERLWRKGLLSREQQGRAYEYTAKASEAEYTAGLMHDLLRGTRDSSGALAHFVRRMRGASETELLRLADEAARRRRS